LALRSSALALADDPSVCHIEAMKTLTIASARKSLSSLLNRVKNGEDIGIIAGDRVVQLKAVEVVAWEDSYLWQEYNVTPGEWQRFNRRLKTRRAKSDYTEFNGRFNAHAFA